MKTAINHISLHRALNASLCALALSLCFSAPAAAQEDGDATETVVVKRKAKKVAKRYPTKTVKGLIVDDATGEPMGGVRIQALGLERYSTLTEEDGTYTLDIPTFSDAVYIYAEGYTPLQAVVEQGKADARMLSGKFKSHYTEGTNIFATKKALLEETSGVSMENEIEKQLSGDIHNTLRSGLPAQGLFMNIRGVNSINANTQPLIILDGNMIDPQYDREALHVGFYNNLLACIDPENIESVEVIKNGTALYGAKGANGVVVITTKRGKSMATKIGVRIYGGVETQPKKLGVMNGKQYTNYLSDLVGTVKDSYINSLNGYAFLNPSKDNYFQQVFTNNTNWQKDLYRNAFMQNYKVNVEGGDDVGMYALSLGYAQAQGTAIGDDMSRLNLRFNTDIKITPKLKTALDIAYNQNDYNILDNGWADDYSMQNIGSTNVLGLVMPSFLSPYSYYMNEANLGTSEYISEILSKSNDYAGKYAKDAYENWQASGKLDWVANPFMFPQTIGKKGINESLRNPYWIIQNGKGNTKNFAQTTQIGLNVAPSYQITKTFTISDRFNYNMVRSSEKFYLPQNGATPYYLQDLGDVTSQLKTMFSKETTLQNDLRLDWRNTYGEHYVNVFGGWRYNNYSFSYNTMSGYNNENDKLPILNKYMKYINYDGTNDNWKDMAYYLDANYNYKNRYFADFALSLQASSRFGKHTEGGMKLFGVSWAAFPSLNLGWLISNESWFKTSKYVNYLKMTAGIEMSGNDDLDYYASRTYWESKNVTHNTVGLYLKNIENSKIQWETTTKFDVGLEGNFFNNRIHAGFDFFYNKTTNLLTLGTIPSISGLKDYWTNDGALSNTGVELNINAIAVNTKDWKWEIGGSLGNYKNKITKLPESNRMEMQHWNWGSNQYVTDKVINGYTASVYGSANSLIAEGYALGSFYGWQTNGVYASDAEAKQATTASPDGYMKYPTGLDGDKAFVNFQAGDIRFVDQNGDGVIDDNDKVVLGNANPKIFGNLYTSLSWKDLRLDMNFKYSVGNDIYNYQRSVLESLNTTYNQTVAATRRWTTEGQVTDMPRACYTNSDDWRNNERMSDRWIEDGSFLKLKNIRLTYKIPYHNSWLLGLQVYGEVNNVFTLTKYLGTDPEMSCRNNALYQGVDTGLIPSARSFNFGVTINL